MEWIVRAKVVPHNATKLSDIKNVVRFSFQYAKDHTILLPGRIPGYKRDDLQLLPSSTTKQEVYHQASLASSDTTAVCYSLFCALWKQLTPQVVVTKPMSDLCWMCQQNSTLIMRGHNQLVEKSEVCTCMCNNLFCSTCCTCHIDTVHLCFIQAHYVERKSCLRSIYKQEVDVSKYKVTSWRRVCLSHHHHMG